ncbi:MAG: hypothetical protein ACP5I4_10020 [Oceanipulchritudo sp.]
MALLFAVAAACGNPMIGRFNPEKDLLLLHYDCKTDVDDIQSAAAAGTLLRDPRFKGVRYHAVAGAYGVQGGLYVPANAVFAMVFGGHWSDAHTDFEAAVDEVAGLARQTLEKGGKVWIAEGGQSDFSAELLRRVEAALPEMAPGDSFHIVQHSDWNEKVTSEDALAYVKSEAAYHKIPDGNGAGNGTPCFRTESSEGWQAVQSEELARIWQAAVAVCETYNGVDGRYVNEAIQKGGLDFSDTVEVCWIFGFSHLEGPPAFFREFANSADEANGDPLPLKAKRAGRE